MTGFLKKGKANVLVSCHKVRIMSGIKSPEQDIWSLSPGGRELQLQGCLQLHLQLDWGTVLHSFYNSASLVAMQEQFPSTVS